MLARSHDNMENILSLSTEISKSKDKKADEQPDNTHMPELESDESEEQNRKQKGVGLKTLTSSQMLSRLPISLAKLKAENNSKKLKIEIKQLLYSLYCSKK